ncbi:MipA/OmpV family protein [Streptomyces sp. IBSBF 2953]|nr:MipA/OmpV family protein [Streptomyces hayashii]
MNQYALNANWTHKFDENWSTYVLVTASELGGKVEDSPLIERKGAVSAVTSISYTF